MKRCPKCSEVKPVTEFNRKRTNADGLKRLCRDCDRESQRQFRAANPGYYSEACRRWRVANPEASRESDRKAKQRRHEANRRAVFNHYGHECACCGSVELLTIDHINGDGKAHREEIGHGSPKLYCWLIANGFPDGFQTLCSPCNKSKRDGDRCRLNHQAAEANAA